MEQKKIRVSVFPTKWKSNTDPLLRWLSFYLFKTDAKFLSALVWHRQSCSASFSPLKENDHPCKAFISLGDIQVHSTPNVSQASLKTFFKEEDIRTEGGEWYPWMCNWAEYCAPKKQRIWKKVMSFHTIVKETWNHRILFSRKNCFLGTALTNLSVWRLCWGFVLW